MYTDQAFIDPADSIPVFSGDTVLLMKGESIAIILTTNRTIQAKSCDVLIRFSVTYIDNPILRIMCAGATDVNAGTITNGLNHSDMITAVEMLKHRKNWETFQWQ